MSNLTWSRRSFLKFSLVSAAAVVVAPRELLTPAIRPLVQPTGPIWISEFLVSAESSGIFCVGRSPEQILLRQPLAGGVWFRWVAAPGHEIVVHPGGLVNLSDDAVTVRFARFRYDGRTYVWSDGRTIPLVPGGDPAYLPVPIIQLAA